MIFQIDFSLLSGLKLTLGPFLGMIFGRISRGGAESGSKGFYCLAHLQNLDV